MSVYQVPPDTKEKEKVIGGMLNWTQFFWLLAGFVFALMLVFLTYLVTKSIILCAVIFLIGFGFSVPFALVRKLDMPLFTYLSRKRSMQKKTKNLINKRKDV
jgi:hypothetical protein